VDPARYGQAPHAKVKTIQRERDETDWRVLDHAYRTRKPVLGICYGMQSLNVYRGGTLLQHIPEQVPGALDHENREIEHGITLEAGSRLAAWTDGVRELRVNSTHHQAPDRVGAGLRVAARAPDGVIEAIEGESADHFVVGVEWHPERLWETEPFAARIFRELVLAATGLLSNSNSPAGVPATVETAR
jgi:putative glutamine amidotransferase